MWCKGRRDQGGRKSLQWPPRLLWPSCSCLPTINHSQPLLSSTIGILNYFHSQSLLYTKLWLPTIIINHDHSQPLPSCSFLPTINHCHHQPVLFKTISNLNHYCHSQLLPNNAVAHNQLLSLPFNTVRPLPLTIAILKSLPSWSTTIANSCRHYQPLPFSTIIGREVSFSLNVTLLLIAMIFCKYVILFC